MKIDCIIGYINTTIELKNYNIHRIRDNNELKYCIRSIVKYLPNLNKIHIILGRDCQPPKFLNLKNPRLNLIKESKLYNNIQLNSETKKLHFHKIKNLTNFFFTFDDDFFLNKKIDIHSYFYNKKLIMHSVGYSPTKFPIINYHDGHGHVPILWSKNLYIKSLKYLNKDFYFINFSNYKRYNPWCLMKLFLLNNNLVIDSKNYNLFYINNTNIENLDYEIKNFILNKKKFNFININDDFSNNINIYKKQVKQINNFLNFLFPNKSEFEI